MRISLSHTAWKTLGLDNPAVVPPGLQIVESRGERVTLDGPSEAFAEIADAADELRNGFNDNPAEVVEACREASEAILSAMKKEG